MTTLHHLWASLSLVLIMSVAARSQIELDLTPRKGQAALVSVEVKIKGKREHELANKTAKSKLKITRRLDYLDVVDLTGSSERVAHTFEGRRRYLRYELEENGLDLDPPLVGATLGLKLRGDGRRELVPEKDAYIGNDYAQAEFRRVGALGFGLGKTIRVPAEGSVDVDLSGLAPMLVAAPELVEKAIAKLSLVAEDEEKGRITLGGPVEFSHGRRRGAEDIGWTWSLQVTLEIDRNANRIVSASAEGRVVGKGSDRDGRINFEGEVESEVEIDIDPKVAKELGRKLKLREVDFQAGETGISFKLPSSYSYVELQPERGYRHVSRTAGTSGQRDFYARFQRTGDAKSKVDEFLAGHRGNGAFEIEKASIKGGKGCSVRAPSQDRKTIIYQEQYATKAGIVHIFYNFPIADAKQGDAEIKRIRKSIRFKR